MVEADPLPGRLLDAAASRFVAVGVRKTTMEEIATAARVTKPTLYRRFPDKAAVVRALVDRETGALDRRLAAAAAAEAAASDALLSSFVVAVRWLYRHPFVRKSLELEPELLLPYLTGRHGPVLSTGHQAFAAVVRRGVAAGEFADREPDAVAEVCWRLVLSFGLMPQAGAVRRDPDSLRALIRHTLLEGLLS